jgi:hypothetical protein
LDTSNEEALSVCPEQANRWKYYQGVSDESLNALGTGDRVHTLGVSVEKDDGIHRFGAWIDVHSADGEWIEGKIVKDRDFGDDYDPILDQVIRVPKQRALPPSSLRVSHWSKKGCVWHARRRQTLGSRSHERNQIVPSARA